MSADELRERTRDSWVQAADRWERMADRFDARSREVTTWLLDAASLEPGQRVIELACGAGGLGIAAAERIGPDGTVLLTDTAETMLEAAQRRAAEAGVGNVSFKVVDAEWIDEPTASFDALLCRWGLMFPVDVEAAMRECRRVLRPGGRLAAAAWGDPDANPWMSAPQRELLEQGLTAPPEEEDPPGPFRFARPPDRFRDLLEGAGFFDVEVEPLELTFRYERFEDFWAFNSQLSNSLQDALALTNDRGREALIEGVRARLERYTDEAGALAIPARPLVASASA